MVWVWSNWLREAIGACWSVLAPDALSEAVFKSVQEAGINERVPSGNISSK
jgi:hypothetical protein